MNRLVVISVVFFMSFILVQCSSSKKAAAPVMTDAQKIAEINKQYTAAQLQEGKTLWQNSCQKCHALYPAESRSIDKWERVLPRMYKRANLDDTQAGKVRAYLLVNSVSN